MHPSLPQYTAQADALHRAVHGLSRDELTARPPAPPLDARPGEPPLGAWSIQEVIVHLWHSDLAVSHRMLRIACENKPLLIAYDENAHVAQLHYNDLDTFTACEVFRLNRLHTADILGRLPDSAFSRQGVHNERGLVSLGDLVAGYVEHVNHHLAFIARKRARMGK